MSVSSTTNTRTAIIMMSVAALSAPVLDCIAKLLSATLTASEIAWARFVLQAVLLSPYFLLAQKADKKFNPWYLLLGICIATTLLFLFLGLKYLPLANNIALFFVEPLILMMIAVLFLGEQITARRWLAVIAGFIGTIIIIRPNYHQYGIALFFPLLAALVFAVYMAATRSFNKKHLNTSPIILQFWVSCCAVGCLTLFAFTGITQENSFFPTAPSLEQYGLLLVSGVIATAAHILVTKALRLTDASILAPLQYLEIFGATLLGWFFFKDIPDGFTILGALIIIASGIYLIRHETNSPSS